MNILYLINLQPQFPQFFAFLAPVHDLRKGLLAPLGEIQTNLSKSCKSLQCYSSCFYYWEADAIVFFCLCCLPFSVEVLFGVVVLFDMDRGWYGTVPLQHNKN